MTDSGMVQYLLDQLDDPRVTESAMFGGHGIYRDGRMFALVYDGTVYMKVSDKEARTSELVEEAQRAATPPRSKRAT